MSSKVTRTVRAAVALTALVTVTSCSESRSTEVTTTPTTLRIAAASSLTDVFTNIGRRYEEKHPGVTVTFSFAATSELSNQVAEGAPFDVIAAADDTTLAKLRATSTSTPPIGQPTPFATNRLALAVAEGNPKHLTSLADVNKAGIAFVMCQSEVPCGHYGNELFAATGLTPHPTARERNVRSVLNRVSTGEVDAGLVYVTDVHDDDTKVDAVRLPDAEKVPVTYTVAAVDPAHPSRQANDFIAFLSTDSARTALAQYRFGHPQ